MEPYDENQINAADTIIRRVDPVQHIVPDHNLKCQRVSSKLFSPSSERNGGMSVDIEGLIDEAGLNARNYVTTPKYTGSVAFNAGAARAVALRIGYDPIPGNPYHGEVWGQDRPNRFKSYQKRELANASKWYVEIPGVVIV